MCVEAAVCFEVDRTGCVNDRIVSIDISRAADPQITGRREHRLILNVFGLTFYALTFKDQFVTVRTIFDFAVTEKVADVLFG